MTAKEYLNGALDIERLINAKRRFLNKLRAQSINLSSVKMTDKVISSCKGNTVVDKIIDLETEISASEEKLVEKQKEIIHRIDLVYHPKLIAVLIDKYITGMSIEQIAEKMEISRRTAYVWHGQALQIFRKETGLK